MKQCMYIEVRTHMCGGSRCGMVALIGGLCCVGFINPFGVEFFGWNPLNVEWTRHQDILIDWPSVVT
jgi:hypothetical protein